MTMNAPDRSDGKRPLWHAMLYGWLACLALAWLLLVALDAIGVTQEHPHSSFPLPPPPARPAAVWLGDVTVMLGWLSLITLGWAALFGLVIRIGEQDGEKPLIFWLLAGLGTALLMALCAAAAREMGTSNSQPVRIFLLFSVYACLPATIGAHVARRFRRPASWQ
jgi:hypothetical protein